MFRQLLPARVAAGLLLAGAALTIAPPPAVAGPPAGCVQVPSKYESMQIIRTIADSASYRADPAIQEKVVVNPPHLAGTATGWSFTAPAYAYAGLAGHVADGVIRLSGNKIVAMSFTIDWSNNFHDRYVFDAPGPNLGGTTVGLAGRWSGYAIRKKFVPFPPGASSIVQLSGQPAKVMFDTTCEAPIDRSKGSVTQKKGGVIWPK